LTEEAASTVPAAQLVPVVQAAMNQPLVRFALADLRMAIQSPDDTGFHAYRAVESCRQYFLGSQPDEGEVRKRSWVTMRLKLGLDKAPIDDLKRHATPRRHGEITVITGPERLAAIKTAREVVGRLIDHLQNQLAEAEGSDTISDRE